MIAELLEGYAAGLAAAPDWPADVAPAVEARGFRREVRELVDRMSELGLEPGVVAVASIKSTNVVIATPGIPA